MRDRAAPGIGAEILTLALVLACLAGTFGIILTLHRQSQESRRPRPTPVVVQAPAPPPPPAPQPAPPPRPKPRPAAPVPPPEDPTPALVAAIASEEAAEREKASAAAAEADRLATERRDFEARQATLKERTELVRQQVSVLDARADNLEGALADLSHYRDVLARERENAREQLAEAKSRDGFAILPYKGQNGTWQRPIPIECRNGTAQIMPDGPRFSLLELSGVGRARSNAMVAAISLYLDRLARSPSPDGAPVVPYLLFIIRPDGIRPYYEARAVLEPFGIRFGYELVDQDEAIEYPNLADLEEWSEEAPLPFAKRWGKDSPHALVSAGGSPDDDPFLWVSPPGGSNPNAGTGPDSAAGALEGLLAGLAGHGGPSDDPGGHGTLPNGDPGAFGGPTPAGSTGLGAFPPGGDGPHVGGAGGLPAGPGGFGPGDGRAGSPFGPGHGTGTSPDGGPTRGQGSALPLDAAPDPGAVAQALAAIEAHEASPLLDPRGNGLRPGTPMSLGADAPGMVLAPGGGGGRGAGMDPSAGQPGSTGGPAGSGAAGASAAGGGTPGSGGSPGGEAGTGTGVDGSRIRFRPRRNLDLVVACNAQGVTIHPGGYRLSRSSLAPGDNRLVQTLRALVERRAVREPENEIRPRLTFLVEPGGQDTYWTIRKQTTYAGLDWPVHLRVAEGTTLAGSQPPLSFGDILR